MSLTHPDTPAESVARRLLEAPVRARDELASLGFENPDRALLNLEHLLDPETLEPLPENLFRELLQVPSPDLALNNFERLTHASRSRAAFFTFLDDPPERCALLLRILGSSQYLFDILVRNPQYSHWLTEKERLTRRCARETVAAEFQEAVRSVERLDSQLNVLRRLTRRELLRIGAGDLVGGRPIDDVAHELSDLADIVVQQLVDLITPDLDARYGIPRNADGTRAEFSVVALGKLGGQELNFSSDIDLIFIYSEKGETDGGDRGRRPVANQTYFSRLAEQVLRAGTEATPEGFLYRIDLRLRPDGASGALTMPLSAYESYYAKRGELWERQMLIKARTCAGSRSLGDRFIEGTKPFVYPRHFEVSPVSEIRRIKRRIEATLSIKGERETHLKLRPGGIRDIEFIVQCLQLIVGRLYGNARSRNTLIAIRQLRNVLALTDMEAATLRGAYLFFRRVEHRLQMMLGLSEYTLPGSETRAPLARSLGFPTPEAYQQTLEGHLASVQAIYQDIFSAEPREEGRTIGAILEMELGDPEAGATLRELGFDRPEEAHRNLIYLAYGHVPRIRGALARQSFVELAPALMQTLSASADRDRALSNLDRLVSAYGAGATLFRILTTNEGLRDLILSLCDGSPFLLDMIVRNPALLDRLTVPDVLHQAPDPERLKAEVDVVVERAGSVEEKVAGLSSFKMRELLRIGSRDLVGIIDTFQTFTELTVLAETVVGKVYEIAFEAVSARRGHPRTAHGEPAAFVVLGLGKLGGREFNFGSDLDLVFVYSEDGSTDGPRPIGNLQFFIHLSQQILNLLGQSTPYGIIYPVDTRLRPEGGSSILALSMDSFERYLQKRAATWERLALSRARVIAGDAAFGRQVLDRIEQFVMGDGLSKREVREIVDIRRRMETKERFQSPLSIKTGPGGIVDVEFIAQVLQIRHGREMAQVRSPNTLESLKLLERAGVLPAAHASALKEALRFLRTVEKVLRRQEERARTGLPSDPRALKALARAVGFSDGNAFQQALREGMAETRAIFQAHLETS